MAQADKCLKYISLKYHWGDGSKKQNGGMIKKVGSTIKKKWNNAICRNVDGPRDYYTKWSKSDRERQIPYDITYMWNLKKKKKMIQMTYLQNRNRLTDIENKLMVTKGGRERTN